MALFAACGATERELTMTDNEVSAQGQKANEAAASNGRHEGYITKQEVARRLKKTVRTVENWQRRGYIPFIKAGHSVLFDWPDVEAHLQKNFRVCRLR